MCLNTGDEAMRNIKLNRMLAILCLVMPGVVLANNNNMNSSLEGPPTINNPSESSGVELMSGSARANSVIEPIAGFTRDQCNISVSGAPRKRDGGYKRSRHFSLWSQDYGTGWRLRAGSRHIQSNSLSNVSNVNVQYQVICAN